MSSNRLSKSSKKNSIAFRNLFNQKLTVLAVSSSLIISSSLLSGCQSTDFVDDFSNTEFLTDYSLLELVPDEEGKQYFLKPDVDWSKYHSLIIEKVIINEADNDKSSSMSRRDRLMMGIYFQNSMRMSVQKDFVVGTIPEAGVLTVRASISDTTSGSTLGAMMGGSYGGVVIEGEIIDSMTGEPLVAIIDQKNGQFLSAYTDWDDAAIALDNWSEQLHTVLQSHMSSSETSPRKYQLATARRLSGNYSQSIANIEDDESKKFNQMLSDTPTAMGTSEESVSVVVTSAVPAPIAQPALQQFAMLEPERMTSAIKEVVKSEPRQRQPPEVTKVSSSLIAVEQMIDETPDIKKEVDISNVSVDPDAVSSNLSLVQEEVAKEPVKQVTAFDPWKNADMGKAQLKSSKLRPFVLGLSANGNIKKIVSAAKKRLTDAGFELVGEYSPYNKTTIIIVTNQAMKSQAARSEFGGYGAAIRVSVTQTTGKVQVSYTNPYYTQSIYRMKGNVNSVAKLLEKTLGHQKVYGSSKGISASDLNDWHYMFGMPYFDDHIVLKDGNSYKALVQSIENNLSNGKGGTKKVYRIDIPGKNETVFGVGITQGSGADKNVMSSIDLAKVKHSAHLPYEILVSNNKAYMLHGKFRIAISFPDLTMGEFMTISMAPGSTEDTMKSVANN